MSPRSNGTTALAERTTSKDALAQLEQVVIQGDLAKLTPEERIAYYARVTESLGINPLTRPFEYITLNGRMVLYARKDATDQLRSIKGISVDRLDREETADLAIVTAYGHDRANRTDSAIGAVAIKGLVGEGLANALMKAETKAKRRMTLSLAGLGWLDETEIGSVEEGAGASGPVVATRREAVASRVAALPEPNETATYQGTEVEVDDIPFEQAARRQGDPWMRKVHAVGAERGLDHDAIHQLTVDKLGVSSLNDLTPYQRAELMQLLEGTEPSQPGTAGRKVRDADTPLPAAVTEAAGGLATPAASIEAPPAEAAAEPATFADSPPVKVSPAPPDPERIEQAVYQAALEHKLIEGTDANADWRVIDAKATEANGSAPPVLIDNTPEELAAHAAYWTPFAAQVAAGIFDATPRRPRKVTA